MHFWERCSLGRHVRRFSLLEVSKCVFIVFFRRQRANEYRLRMLGHGAHFADRWAKKSEEFFQDFFCDWTVHAPKCIVSRSSWCALRLAAYLWILFKVRYSNFFPRSDKGPLCLRWWVFFEFWNLELKIYVPMLICGFLMFPS